MVIGTLALLFCNFCNLQFSYGAIGKQGSGSRGTVSYRMQGIFCPSFLGLGIKALISKPRLLGRGILNLASWA